MFFSRAQDGRRESAEAEPVVVAAVGWAAETEETRTFARHGRRDRSRAGSLSVDSIPSRVGGLTSSPRATITGRLLLVPPALQERLRGGDERGARSRTVALSGIRPVARAAFLDPEYAQVGLTEARSSREAHEVVAAVARFDAAARTIIDGRTSGALQADRRAGERGRSWAATPSASGPSTSLSWLPSLLNAHERPTRSLRVPLSFPTHAKSRPRCRATREG